MESMSLKAIKEYRNQNYHPSNEKLCVVGGPDQVIDHLKALPKTTKNKKLQLKKASKKTRFVGQNLAVMNIQTTNIGYL